MVRHASSLPEAARALGISRTTLWRENEKIRHRET
ncbi:MAG: helix-turn-helix domain-containing protein [Deltaproteobacteria bacterium]|nr:helix-turn-helix domain-containing protein [Deltaproteobacteria bacterium]